MNKANVQAYFDHHPDIDTFYFTADGQAFFTQNEADNHARNLIQNNKDADIEKIDRADLLNSADDEAVTADEELTESTDSPTKAAAKKAASKKK